MAVLFSQSDFEGYISGYVAWRGLESVPSCLKPKAPSGQLFDQIVPLGIAHIFLITGAEISAVRIAGLTLKAHYPHLSTIPLPRHSWVGPNTRPILPNRPKQIEPTP